MEVVGEHSSEDTKNWIKSPAIRVRGLNNVPFEIAHLESSGGGIVRECVCQDVRVTASHPSPQ